MEFVTWWFCCKPDACSQDGLGLYALYYCFMQKLYIGHNSTTEWQGFVQDVWSITITHRIISFPFGGPIAIVTRPALNADKPSATLDP